MTESDQSQIARRRFATRIAATILVIHGLMLAWVSFVDSPNSDERGHLAAGISHWTFGSFDLYRVNPPLVRMVAAAPIYLTDAKISWSGWNTASVYSRSEFHLGEQFVLQNGMSAFWYFTLARWACIPMCLVGAWTAYCWASELYGAASGLAAICLYCFCPNMIAWGASINPDAAGASFGLLAAYAFWKWLKKPSWGRAFLAGSALGFAELAKATWIVLFALWPFIWLAHRLGVPKRSEFERVQKPDESLPDPVGLINAESPSPSVSPPLSQLVIILLVAFYLLNLGYGFEGSFKRLDEFKFISKTLSGEFHPPAGGNRFVGTWIQSLPVPVPENFVRGLDVQKFDFERGNWSYLCGEQRKGGWWYYYLFGFLVKSPIGALALLFLSTILIFQRKYSSTWQNELTLLLPLIVVLVLVSSQTGFNRYLRYAIPVLPFAYIHASRVALAIERRHWILSGVVIASCAGTVAESLSAFPHSMSFFNCCVGGPLNGHAYLLDSNIDWGQDLLFLKRWYDAHPEAKPFHLAYFGDLGAGPHAAGIVGEPVPGFLAAHVGSAESVDLSGPKPGWFAVSINHIKGYRHYEWDRPKFTYFQRVNPIAHGGYSIYMYHLTADQADALRAELVASPNRERTTD